MDTAGVVTFAYAYEVAEHAYMSWTVTMSVDRPYVPYPAAKKNPELTVDAVNPDMTVAVVVAVHDEGSPDLYENE